MKEFSQLTGREYEIEDSVTIVNPKQYGLYIKHNLNPIDLFWSKDRLVMVFNKFESKRLYEKWCKHELD